MSLLVISGFSGALLPQRSAVSIPRSAVHAIARAADATMAIESVKARQIYDSRGNPTVEVDLVAGGVLSRASVPSGASTGAYEAVELRDGGDRHMGKGVLTAVDNVNKVLAPQLVGMDPTDQAAIDAKMNGLDGTANKGTVGANAILGVSLAAAKAGAAAKGVPLYRHFADLAGNSQLMMPVPCFNVINGGSHAGNKLPFQEYFVIPTGAASFKEGMLIGTEARPDAAAALALTAPRAAHPHPAPAGLPQPRKDPQEEVRRRRHADRRRGAPRRCSESSAPHRSARPSPRTPPRPSPPLQGGFAPPCDSRSGVPRSRRGRQPRSRHAHDTSTTCAV